LETQDSMGGGRRKSPQGLQVKDTGVTALCGYERRYCRRAELRNPCGQSGRLLQLVEAGMETQDSMGGGRRSSPQRNLQVKDTGVTALCGVLVGVCLDCWGHRDVCVDQSHWVGPINWDRKRSARQEGIGAQVGETRFSDTGLGLRGRRGSRGARLFLGRAWEQAGAWSWRASRSTRQEGWCASGGRGDLRKVERKAGGQRSASGLRSKLSLRKGFYCMCVS
jgi:hypothetical protein